MDRRIRVTWNQWAWPISADFWAIHSSAQGMVSYSDGIATISYIADNGGADGSLRGKTDAQRHYPAIGQVWYGAYMLNPDFSTGLWSIDFCNIVHPMRVAADANVWIRLSGTSIATQERTAGYHMYISNIRNSSAHPSGHSAKVKRPVLVNLTQMYGAGNEPDTEEFERQCVLNGVDLTAPLAVDTGTERIWKV